MDDLAAQASAPTSPFEIPELLVSIFEQLSDDPRTLAVCARVCGAWSARSLEVLWRGPTWASQLITVLPPSMAPVCPFGFDKADFDPLRNQRFISRPPTPSEMARVQKYANLVEHLRFDESDALHPFFTARLTFPKLKKIDAQPAIDAEVVLTCGPLFNENITHAVLVLHDGEDEDEDETDSEDEEEDDEAEGPPGVNHFDSAAISTLLDYAVRSSPNITHLELSLGKTASPTFLQFLAPLRLALRSLAIHLDNFRSVDKASQNPFPLNALYDLDGFTALTHFEINVHNYLPADDVGSYPRKIDLPSLSSLTVGSISHVGLPDVLNLFDPSPVRSLVLLGIPFRSKASSRRIQELAAQISRSVGRFENLESLRWLNDESTERVKHDVYGPALEKPLSRMSNLRTLQLADAYLLMPNDFYDKIHIYFPHVKNLAVATRAFRIDDLVTLSRTCPQLEHLAVGPHALRSRDGHFDEPLVAFKHLKSFGDMLLPSAISLPPNSMLVSQLLSGAGADVLKRGLFPLSCSFGPSQPFMEYILSTPYGQFKAAAMGEGDPVDFMEDLLGVGDEEEAEEDDEEGSLDGFTDEGESGAENEGDGGDWEDESEGSWEDDGSNVDV